jgi:hypothetical protein
MPRSKQLGSQTRRCRAEQAARQAARRGDAEQPRRCAGRQTGAHRRGEDSPPGRGQRTSEFAVASYVYFLGILFETQEDLGKTRSDCIELLSYKSIELAAGPLKPAC